LRTFLDFIDLESKEFAVVADGDCLQRGGELLLRRVFVSQTFYSDAWGDGFTDLLSDGDSFIWSGLPTQAQGVFY